jgi:predicted TIM-barrel fold metal-dependent hydrolase
MSDGQLIDWHTHCFLPEHLDATARATMRARGVIGGEAGPEEHRRGVVEGGAEKFVVIKMPTAWGRSIPNDFPGRAVGFAAVDPNDAGAADEVERSIVQLRLGGLKLSPVYHGFDPWSPPAWRLYELADRLRVPVMFHVGGAGSSGAVRSCWTGSPWRSRACG